MGRKKGGMNEADFGFGHVPPEDRSFDDRFVEFHQRYPKIFDMFRKCAEDLLDKGFKKYSPDIIVHMIRLTLDLEYGPGAAGVAFPKVNDQITRGFADYLKEQDARFEKFFPKRCRKRA